MTLLTSLQAASLLKVGESTVKRWADDGTLACVRTPGGHRRFTREAIEDFRRLQRARSVDAADTVQQWLDALLSVDAPTALTARLLQERHALGSFWRVADALLPVVGALMDRRREGRMTLLEELLALEQLGRALLRVGDLLPASSHAPRALLVPSESDEQTIHLSLAELCLRELGYLTLCTPRRTPLSSVAGAGATHGVRVMVISASARSRDAEQLAAQAQLVGRACRLHGVTLFMVGPGPWPESPGFGHVLRDHRNLHHTVAALPRD